MDKSYIKSFIKGIIEKKIISEGKEISSFLPPQEIDKIYTLGVNWLKKHFRNGIFPTEKIKFNIKIADSPFNFNSRQVRNGLVFFYAFYFMKEKVRSNGYSELKSINSLPEEWIKFYNKETKSFSDELIEDIKQKSISITISFEYLENFKGLWSLEDLTVSINPMKTGINNLKTTIRHELQHATADFNTACIYYGQQLDKLNNPFAVEKIKLEDLINEKSLEMDKAQYGTGKELTGLYGGRELPKQKVKELESTLKEKIKLLKNSSEGPFFKEIFNNQDKEKRKKDIYFINDISSDKEYSNWKSDTLDLLVKDIKDKFNSEIVSIKRKQDLKILSQDKSELLSHFKEYPDDKEFYYSNVLKDTDKIPDNFNELSVNIIKDLLEEPELFMRDKGNIIFIKTLKILRPNEFPRDMVADLENRLKRL